MRPLRGGVRSRGEARAQAASLNSENCIVVDSRISSGNRTQSRPCASIRRQQSCSRQGERMGHHRGLRAGHAFRGVTRELGRASRLLGSHRRSAGDRRKQHPGVNRWTRAVNEPKPARAGRNTKSSASTQGTGREPKANQPGWTKVVVATLGAGENRRHGGTVRSAEIRRIGKMMGAQ